MNFTCTPQSQFLARCRHENGVLVYHIFLSKLSARSNGCDKIIEKEHTARETDRSGSQDLCSKEVAFCITNLC